MPAAASPVAATRDASSREIAIGRRRLGPGHPMFVIAELSANHNGSLERALETVRAAATAGADAVKLQTYTPDSMTLDSDDPAFMVPGGGPWGGKKLYDLYTTAHTPWDWHAPLFAEARSLGLEVFSTPFDPNSVDLLATLEPPIYKVASFELVDDALLRRVATTGRPVILSTGMASFEEIEHALAVLDGAGCPDVVLLKCTSSYPAPDDAMNLRAIPVLAETTGRLVGLSDHSVGSTAAVVARALGAAVLEKHFTLNRSGGGVDSHFSMDPREFADMVAEIRRVESMLGTGSLETSAAEDKERRFRRSLYAVADIQAGERLTADNVRTIRPGFGLPPRYLDVIVGRRAVTAIAKATPLRWEHIDPSA